MNEFSPPVTAFLQFNLLAFSSVFFTVNPLASIPALQAMRARLDTRRRQLARRAAMYGRPGTHRVCLDGEHHV